MKKIILITFLSTFNFIFCQSRFNNGFNDGYKKGYCHDKGIGCIEPIPPIPPIPAIGEDYNNYQDGYNRGFKLGLQKNTPNSNSSSQTRERYKTSSSQFVEDYVYNPYKDPNFLSLAMKVAELKAQRALENQEMVNQLYENVKYYLQQKDINQAIRNLDKISYIEPNNAYIYALLSQCYFSQSKYLDAYNNFTKAQKLNYSDINKLIFIKEQSIGYLSSSMSKENYIDVLNFTRNVWYETEITSYYLGLAHYYLKEYDEAKLVFKKLRGFINARDYVDAIKKEKFIPNPYIEKK